ncbi:MAG: NAD(P)H-hydrate dehydratase [Oscillospiraceae bacterium]|nr:NAD(P)H-hydrate dehydratase [Oscillospiraceae bacterium]
MRILTAQEMRNLEALAVEEGLSYERLMDNAGSAAAAAINRTIPVDGLSCLIVCGNGNNGGDGFVVARRLVERGARVAVVLVLGPPKTEQSLAMLDLVRQMEIPVWNAALESEEVQIALSQADIIVDAMLGVGFHGVLPEPAAAISQQVNAAIAAVFAIDLPSGVDADNGFVCPGSIRADFTITFDSLKPAHVLYPGKEAMGEIEAVDIGISDKCHEKGAISHFLIDEETIFSGLKKRTPHSHKGCYGRLLNLCGSAKMAGAAVISALSAARCGVGMLTVASAPRALAALNVRLPEAMTISLEETPEGEIAASNFQRLQKALSLSSACLIGCGLGNGPQTQELIPALVKTAACPLIIDADGINALIPSIDILQQAKAAVILTPHMGEMARLLGCSVAELEEHRIQYALRFAEEHNVLLVLKSSTTTVVTPEGAVFISSVGNAGLARGGSGDLLSGLIAAFCAQGYSPLQSAAAGVYLHGAAADRCALRLSQYAMLPTDLLEDLSQIFLEHGF